MPSSTSGSPISGNEFAGNGNYAIKLVGVAKNVKAYGNIWDAETQRRINETSVACFQNLPVIYDRFDNSGLGLVIYNPVEVFGALAITQNTVWSAARSPYVLDGDLQVAAGATLTIEPGVAIYVQRGIAIRVSGTLQAPGTAAQPISFLPANCTNPQPGDWQGLIFNSSVGSVLNYCLIRNAMTGILQPSWRSPASDACASQAMGDR